MRKFPRIVLAVLVGCAIATIVSVFRHHFKAGSIADLVCELLSVPGDLIAVLIGTVFHDRGNASPEFLWRSRPATAVLFSAVAYWAMRYKNTSKS
jgi:hypothetical protein